MLGVPIVAAVSAPSLVVELAERFNVALAGFVRAMQPLYAHSWRVARSVDQVLTFTSPRVFHRAG